jgi:HK97 family phage portal protein
VSIWDGLFGRRSVKLTDTTGWFLDQGSHAGKSVTADSTLQLSTAWRCVRLRSRVLGSLPMNVHERLEDGGTRLAKDHWLYKIVHDSPNADQSAAEFWGGMVACIDLWGNAYARIDRTGDRVSSLTPLRPDLMSVYRENGGRHYRYSAPTGEERHTERDILHLRGFTLGGDVGLSAVSYGRHTMGLSLAAEETASKTFAKGLQIAGFVEMATGTKLTPEQRTSLVELFERFAGSSKAGKVMPLDPGMKFTPLSMSPADAQLLESRGFNVEEICRWFDVPPILVGHAGPGQTMWGSGVEQIMLGWLTLDLNPFLKGIEQAVMKQLLSAGERLRYFPEYNREALLEADSAAKAAFLSSMVQNGLMSRNEGRAKLNQSQVPGADALTVQSNLLPLDLLGVAPARAVQPAPGEPV